MIFSCFSTRKPLCRGAWGWRGLRKNRTERQKERIPEKRRNTTKSKSNIRKTNLHPCFTAESGLGMRCDATLGTVHRFVEVVDGCMLDVRLLRHGLRPKVFHRDVKPANIMSPGCRELGQVLVGLSLSLCLMESSAKVMLPVKQDNRHATSQAGRFRCRKGTANRGRYCAWWRARLSVCVCVCARADLLGESRASQGFTRTQAERCCVL